LENIAYTIANGNKLKRLLLLRGTTIDLSEDGLETLFNVISYSLNENLKHLIAFIRYEVISSRWSQVGGARRNT